MENPYIAVCVLEDGVGWCISTAINFAYACHEQRLVMLSESVFLSGICSHTHKHTPTGENFLSLPLSLQLQEELKGGGLNKVGAKQDTGQKGGGGRTKSRRQ